MAGIRLSPNRSEPLTKLLRKFVKSGYYFKGETAVELDDESNLNIYVFDKTVSPNDSDKQKTESKFKLVTSESNDSDFSIAGVNQKVKKIYFNSDSDFAFLDSEYNIIFSIARPLVAAPRAFDSDKLQFRADLPIVEAKPILKISEPPGNYYITLDSDSETWTYILGLRTVNGFGVEPDGNLFLSLTRVKLGTFANRPDSDRDTLVYIVTGDSDITLEGQTSIYDPEKKRWFDFGANNENLDKFYQKNGTESYTGILQTSLTVDEFTNDDEVVNKLYAYTQMIKDSEFQNVIKFFDSDDTIHYPNVDSDNDYLVFVQTSLRINERNKRLDYLNLPDYMDDFLYLKGCSIDSDLTTAYLNIQTNLFSSQIPFTLNVYKNNNLESYDFDSEGVSNLKTDFTLGDPTNQEFIIRINKFNKSDTIKIFAEFHEGGNSTLLKEINTNIFKNVDNSITDFGTY